MNEPVKNRTPCERYTRVMGYHRPVSTWNKGKQSEFAERTCFDITKENGVKLDSGTMRYAPAE